MKKYFLILAVLLSCGQQPRVDAPVSEKTAEQEIKGTLLNTEEQIDKPYVLLISIDGFRYDYAQKYGAENLLAFDVKSEKMIPSFPTKTFPNHYAIVTGLYPGHNGLVSNEFYDRSLKLTYTTRNRERVEDAQFYEGTPLWVLAAEQGMVSGSVFWVGSEAPIKDHYPTYYFKYNGEISYEDRINQVVKWLELPKEKRPHFITLYFSITDDLGHRFGPESEEIKKGVLEIDSLIGELTRKIDQLKLPVNTIVVSDHGMLEVDRESIIYPEKLIPEDMLLTTSFPAMVYSDDASRIDSLYNALSKDTTQYEVYLKNHLPERFHYDKNLDRIGDLDLLPKPPYTFGALGKTIPKGSSTHGYDAATTPEMGAIFYAKGPAFKQTTIPPFENVNVYPLIANILGLSYEADSIDGKLEVLEPILK
ncbi:MAG: alkaline phosphatase family protein [Cyclobacteriaceae bacterium]|nr:alkaline phosphatase family protein [Cyclobacteriaceae bacterium]